MQSIAFALQLAGQAVDLDGGRFWVETREPTGRGGDDPPRLDGIGDGNASCRRQLELRPDGSLVQAGELDFGTGDTISFRARGVIGTSPDPSRRHGTAVLEITGGRGRLAGARGYVTSNFLLAESGELVDHQLGVLFLEREPSLTRGAPCVDAF